MILKPSRDPSARDYNVASILTADIPVTLAFTSYWMAPWGCDANAWLCLLPLSLFGVAPIAALCLPILFFINRRRAHPLPDGWLSIMLSTGVVAQLLVTGYSLWLLEPYLRRMFFFEAPIFPRGFGAGAIVGAVFWFSLAVLGKARMATK